MDGETEILNVLRKCYGKDGRGKHLSSYGFTYNGQQYPWIQENGYCVAPLNRADREDAKDFYHLLTGSFYSAERYWNYIFGPTSPWKDITKGNITIFRNGEGKPDVVKLHDVGNKPLSFTVNWIIGIRQPREYPDYIHDFNFWLDEGFPEPYALYLAYVVTILKTTVIHDLQGDGHKQFDGGNLSVKRLANSNPGSCPNKLLFKAEGKYSAYPSRMSTSFWGVEEKRKTTDIISLTRESSQLKYTGAFPTMYNRLNNFTQEIPLSKAVKGFHETMEQWD